MIFALFPYPKRLKLALGLLFAYSASGLRALVQASGLRRLLPRWLAELAALTPSVTWRQLTSTLPDRIASGPGSACVGLVAGCVQRVMFPEVNEATIRVLAAEACEVIVPRGQGCCGALSIHAGREAEARAFARALIERFESNIGLFDAILVNAAGCGSHLKDYGRLLAADSAFGVRAAAFAAKVRDVNEFLSSRAPVAKRHPVAVRVAYHDPCHLAHAQRLREEPRALLRSIPGLELVEIPEGDQCCGSAGIYNLLQPESARAIGERKADNVLATRAELLVSANPGCTLQIRKILRARGIDLPAAHPIEVLDASLAGRRVGVDAERIEHD